MSLVSASEVHVIYPIEPRCATKREYHYSQKPKNTSSPHLAQRDATFSLEAQVVFSPVFNGDPFTLLNSPYWNRQLGRIRRPPYLDSVTNEEAEFAFMSGFHGSAPLTRPSATKAKSKAPVIPQTLDTYSYFPAWLQSAMQCSYGPSVALAYELRQLPSGAQDIHCVPLYCTYPKDHSSPPRGAPYLDTSTFGYFDYSFNASSGCYESSVARGIKGKSLGSHEKRKGCSQPVLVSKSFQIPRPATKPWTSTRTPNRTTINLLDTGKIPVEIFEIIIAHLSRNDVKSLRLVDKNFGRGVSRDLFHTVVVPFDTEIYGMHSLHPELGDENQRECKHKDKAWKSSPAQNKNNITSMLLNGPPLTALDHRKSVDVFRGFGPHIQRYGMSFDVDEDILANLGYKSIQQGHGAYWGVYNWPYPEYRRFTDRAGLELAADETSTMTRAFSNLTGVKHLALSLDSGLGWLKGPDESIRARVLECPSKIFGRSRYLTEPSILAQRRLWSMLQYSYCEGRGQDQLKVAELVRIKKNNAMSLARSEIRQEWMNINMRLLSAAALESTSDSLSRLRTKSMDQGSRPQITSSFQSRGALRTITPLQMTAAAQIHGSIPVRGRRRSYSYRTRGYARSADTTSQPNILRRGSAPRHNEESVNGEEIVHSTLQVTKRVSQGHEVEGLSKKVSALDLATVAKSYEDTEFNGKDDADEVSSENQSSYQSGIFYTRAMDAGGEASKPRSNHIIPNKLTQTQQEWLLETAWAQDAFLSSYMLSIADNYEIFRNVKSLTISRLSSRHLSKMCRDDFWNSLPCLSKFEIRVIADWRDVQKDQTGCTTTPTIEPTSAVTSFHYLLATILSTKSTIKIMSIGWVEGGEHAEGLRARNRNLSPAPIVSRQSNTVTDSRFPDMLVLPYVEKLIIANCWMTPNALTTFIDLHKTTALRQLILESVSMSTHPRFDVQQNGGAGVQALPLLLAQLGNVAYGALVQQAQLAGIPLHQLIQQAIALQQNHAGNLQAGNGQVGNPQAGNVFPPLIVQQLAVALPQQMGHVLPLPLNQPPPRLREGSWPDVLERIKADRIQAHRTALELTLLSCGYVRLRQAPFDQTALEHEEVAQAAVANSSQEAFFAKRRSALQEFGMSSPDALLGTIVTAMPDGEMEVLQGTWNLREGWPSSEMLGEEYDDEDGWGKWSENTKDAAEFDGARRGGTGRFSGKVPNFDAHLGDDEDG